MLSVEWNNGHLVASLNSTAGSDAAAAWYLLSTSGASPTLSQQGVIHPGSGISTYFAAVTVDAAGDMAMTYMESSSTENPSMHVTGRLATDAPNSMEPSVRAQAGTIALNPNRAGDYGGIALDPSAANTYWAINEYAPSGASWGVFISQFTVLYPDPDVPDQTKHGLIAQESAGDQSASSDSLSWISATTLSGASVSVDSSSQQEPSASEGTLSNAIQELQQRLVDGAANQSSALTGAQNANKHSAIGMLFETLNASLDAAASELLSL
jgi:hypothetical protein